MDETEVLMRRCLTLARRGGRAVRENPLVGCVIVKSGRIIGEGWHTGHGKAHAEVEALRSCTEDPRGATLYVNLEPCNHQGKTPPCTDAILSAGIHSVVIGMRDPNPGVAGRGLERLRAAGCDCHLGVLETACRDVNRRFLVNVTSQRPYVTMKIAQTLTGMITVPNFGERYFSGQEALRRVHALRGAHDAVVIGAGTLRQDDPLLTVRHVKAAQPTRVIVTSRMGVPTKARIFDTVSENAPVWVITTKTAYTQSARKVANLSSRGVRILRLAERKGGDRLLAPSQILKALWKLRMTSVLLEGGIDVFSQFMVSRLVDQLDCIITPILSGRGENAFTRMRDLRVLAQEGFIAEKPSLSGQDIWLRYLRSI